MSRTKDQLSADFFFKLKLDYVVQPYFLGVFSIS